MAPAHSNANTGPAATLTGRAGFGPARPGRLPALLIIHPHAVEPGGSRRDGIEDPEGAAGAISADQRLPGGREGGCEFEIVGKVAHAVPGDLPRLVRAGLDL